MAEPSSHLVAPRAIDRFSLIFRLRPLHSIPLEIARGWGEWNVLTRRARIHLSRFALKIGSAAPYARRKLSNLGFMAPVSSADTKRLPLVETALSVQFEL